MAAPLDGSILFILSIGSWAILWLFQHLPTYWQRLSSYLPTCFNTYLLAKTIVLPTYLPTCFNTYLHFGKEYWPNTKEIKRQHLRWNDHGANLTKKFQSLLLPNVRKNNFLVTGIRTKGASKVISFKSCAFDCSSIQPVILWLVF